MIFPSGPVIGTQKLLLVLSIVIVVPLEQLFAVPLVTSIASGMELLPPSSAYPRKVYFIIQFVQPGTVG